MNPQLLPHSVFAALLATAPLAAAQTPCQVNAGPDVVLTNISGIANYVVDSGYDALSLSMTLTNLGTAEAAYAFGTNAHPVIGSALYRFRTVDGSTRFEEVGQSWVFHTFFALSQQDACTCTPTGGTTLGIGCTDTSSAASQGSASFLGPRTEIDGYTGAFPMPHGGPARGDQHAGRLRVAVGDLASTAGGLVRYFAEKHVVAADDATAGHRENNASYREISATELAGDWLFGFVGPAQREKHALDAWQAIDPDVVLTTMTLAGEGTFVLGAKATALGGGLWHYEYALYNATSGRGARAFEVALPAGVHVSSAGFHDVDYHGGDGPGGVDVDGTDWTLSHGATRVHWSTQSAAENPSANALRWRSLYNFRFDANAAPRLGPATVTAFEGDATVSGSTLVPMGVPIAGTIFCFGDGSLATACPCSPPNTVPSPSGVAGAGCANSFEPSGARLRSFGATTPDLVVLQATELPPSTFTQFFVGTATDAAGFAVGDGVRCVGGTLVRFGSQNAYLGTAVYPTAGPFQALPISIVGATPPGSGLSAHYQALYRNTALNFCSAGTINLTNATTRIWN